MHAMLPPATATLHIGGLLVTNNYQDRPEEAFSSIGMQEYLIRREGWDTTTLSDVDWPHLEYSITKLFKSNKRRFARYVKFMIDMPHTGRQKQKFTINTKAKPTVDHIFPCCKADEETTMHLYHCPHSDIRAELKRSFQQLSNTLEK